MKLTVFSIFSLLSIITFGQSKFEIGNHTCSYYGEEITDDIYSFSSTNEAIKIITRIVDAVGLEQNFEVRAANVPNAAAVIFEDKRYILYSQVFMSEIESTTKTKWASISILAHEIGHHLNGHTLDSIGSRPDKELEADKFSGFVCYMLGGTLKEAQEAMRHISSETSSDTHPPKSARLEAIANGWYQAKEKQDETGNATNTETEPTTIPEEGPSASPTETSSSLGGVCFKNLNNYPREVVVTNKKTKEVFTLILSKAAESCLYDLPEGTYAYKVYSVNVRFNGKVVTAQSQFKIKPDQTKNIKLIIDNNF